jgi:hypothetical protein
MKLKLQQNQYTSLESLTHILIWDNDKLMMVLKVHNYSLWQKYLIITIVTMKMMGKELLKPISKYFT